MRSGNADSKFNMHAIKRWRRIIIAATLAAVYLIISLSPLASLATHSKPVSSVLAGECSGDCKTCGCSPESMKSRTCCCSKKREQQAHLHEERRDNKEECCRKTADKKDMVIISCGSPCGGGKQSALSSNGTSSELLPFHFTEQLSCPCSGTTLIKPIQRLTSRHCEPPDPPPRLSSIHL